MYAFKEILKIYIKMSSKKRLFIKPLLLFEPIAGGRFMYISE